MLAAECIRDVGPTRVEGDLAATLRQRLQSELEKPLPVSEGEATWMTRLWGKLTGVAEQRKAIIIRRIAAATALSRIETGSFATSGQYWLLPYGEPEWVTIPAGEFWMGDDRGADDEKPAHRLFVPEFHLLRPSGRRLCVVIRTSVSIPGEINLT